MAITDIMRHSTIGRAFLLVLCLALRTGTANADIPGGWYQVKTYAGTIGTARVHVSLQTFGWIDHGSAGEWRVEGSYYYDAHRLPIALEGTRTSQGGMTLCEATPPSTLSDSPIIPPPLKNHPDDCQFHITVKDPVAAGQWTFGAKTLPIDLHQVGSLDGTDDNHFQFKGPLEIPMWYHTKKDLLVGVYTSDPASDDCLLSMTTLRLVNLKTGKIDKTVHFDCEAGAGTIATRIYSNVFESAVANAVTVEFQGGDHNMGQDTDVKIGP